MNYNEFLEILKYQSKNGKIMSLNKVKRDYYTLFLSAMITYNTNNPNRKVNISSAAYDLYFDRAIDEGKLLRVCCGYFKLKY